MSASPFAAVLPGLGRQLCYIAVADEWSILWRCDHCRGVSVPLLRRPDTADHSQWIAAVGEATRGHGCPACDARTKRETPGATDVWWDPDAGGWVVCLPVGAEGSAVLPLEIRWFDAPRALIYSAAADLVYADDAFSRAEEA